MSNVNGSPGIRALWLLPLLAALLFLVACGDDATSTPLPTATPTAVSPTATPTPTPAPTATPTPSFATSGVDQLVIAMAPLLHDSLLPWRGVVATPAMWGMMEFLLAKNLETGAYEARLATAWDLSGDGLAWTLNLRENVPFHFDWGEFTAADVVHTLDMLTSDQSITANSSTWRNALESKEIVDDHNLVLHLTRPGPDLIFQMAVAGSNVNHSKAQWDSEGDDGLLDGPAGTGPWQYLDWAAGDFSLLERVEDHWRKTPEFKELRIQVATEDATRLAMLLGGEAHITDLPTDIQEEALSRGFQRITSTFPSGTPWYFFFGGQYYVTPESLDPDEPLTNIKVREAINRAIDREEIIETIFQGRAELSTHVSFHPSLQGWDSSWTDRWPDLYGFDPDKARELLTEAGYPDGFDLELYDIPWGGAPEIHQVVEALALYLQDVGINATIQSVGFEVTQDDLTNKNLHDHLLPQAPYSQYPSAQHARFLNFSEGGFVGFEDEFLDGKFNELDVTHDLNVRDRIVREIGEHVFVNYGEISLFHTFFEAIVDPDVVGGYPVPGNVSAKYTHTEYITAAQ